MKKIVGICLFSLLEAACAGTPPAWWNPGNKYSPENKQGTSATTSATVPAAPTNTRTQVPTEQSISLPAEDFEEMALPPLQDEEGENDSGDTSSQSLPSLEEALPGPSVLE